MKKLLLTLFLILGAVGLASADGTFEVTKANIEGWGYTAPEASNGLPLSSDKPLQNNNVKAIVTQASGKTEAQQLRWWNASGNYELRSSSSGIGHKLTFTTSDNSNITKIKFTATKYGATVQSSDNDKITLSSNNLEWTGNAAEVVFTTTGEVRITKIEVTTKASGPAEYSCTDFADFSLEVGESKTLDLGDSHPEVSYKAETDDIVSIEGNTFTGVAKGSTKVTASWEASDDWTKGSQEFTVTVTAKLKDASIDVASEVALDVADNKTATVPFTYNGDGTVNATSDNENIATATIEGNHVVITATGTGTATITLKAAATDAYKEATATIAVTVIDPNAIHATVTMANQSDLAYAKDKTITWKSDDGKYEFNTSATVSVNSNYPVKYNNNLRLYKTSNNIITICAPEGYYFVSASAVLGTSENKIAIDGTTLDDKAVYSFVTQATSFELTSVASKNSDVTSMTFVLGELVVDTRLKPELSFPAGPYKGYVGEDFVEPKLTTDPEGLAITYSSSNDKIAEVDATTGEVKLIAAGSATITATFVGNNTYRSGSASYEITVSEPPYESFKDLFDLPAETPIEMATKMTVVYQHDLNLYVVAEDGSAMLIYGMTEPSDLKNGDIFTKLSGKTHDQKGQIEITEASIESDITRGGEAVNPAAKAINEIDASLSCQYVMIKGVKLAALASNNSTATVDGAPVALYNQFNITWPNDLDAEYDLIGFVGIYNGTVQIRPTEFVEVPDDHADAELSFGEETEFTCNLGETFTAPELTNPHDLTVKYTSSKNDVAEVDEETGAVTIKAEGTTTITATFEGNDEYKYDSASYTLTVVDPNNLKAEIEFKDQYGESNAVKLETISLANGIITLNFGKGTHLNNTPTYYKSDHTARMYEGNELAVNSASGYIIKKVEFTCTSGYFDNSEVTPGTIENKVWSFEGIATSSATLACGAGKPQITHIVVYYSPDPRKNITDAEISLVGGDVDEAYEIAMDNMYVNAKEAQNCLEYTLTNLPEDLTTNITWTEIRDENGNCEIDVVGEGVDVLISIKENRTPCGIHRFKAIFSGDNNYAPFEKEFELAVYPDIYTHFGSIIGRWGNIHADWVETDKDTKEMTFRLPDLTGAIAVEKYNYLYRHVEKNAENAPRKAATTGPATDGFETYNATDGITLNKEPGIHSLELAVSRNGVTSPIVTANYELDEDGSVTGISFIEADSTEAELYDLNGRKVVGTPAAGLYIEIRNGKAVKVVK